MKHFFNEKEVTSTLVMDALYSGCKQVEENGRLHAALKVRTLSSSCQIADSVPAHRPRGVWPAHAVLPSAGFAGDSAEAAVQLCTKGLLGWPACSWQSNLHAVGQYTACSACPMSACPWLQSGPIVVHLKLMQLLLVVQGKRKSATSPMVTINAVRNTYTLASDVATLLERAANETIPAFRDDKPADSLAARHAQVEHTICKSTATRSDVSLPECWLDQTGLQTDRSAGNQLL